MAKTKRVAVKPAKKAVKRVSASSVRAKCFVISPFGGWFDSYYSAILQPAIEAANLTPCRADDLYRPSSIIHDIWRFVSQATVLLADLTGKNPNVLYELGLAHAIGKPVVMITQDLDDVPFDLRNLRVITYEMRDPSWASLLAESITHSLKEVMAEPESAVPPAFLHERQDSKAPQVTPIEKKVLELTQQVDSLRRSQRGVAMAAEDIIGPDEARATIRRWLRNDMPIPMIIERLENRGVPVDFIEREIKRYRVGSRGSDRIEDTSLT